MRDITMKPTDDPNFDDTLVLRAGLEGGSLDIRRTDAGYTLTTGSIWMDENDDEDWRTHTSGPFATLDEALDALRMPLPMFMPIYVAPDVLVQIRPRLDRAADYPHTGYLWTEPIRP